jgi:hypothetical protein
MLAELVLAGVAAATLVGHTVLALSWSRERARLLDAVMSRSVQELVSLRRADVPAGPPRETRVRKTTEPVEQIGL